MSLIELATGLSLAITSFGDAELGKKYEHYLLGMFFQDVITDYISLTQVSLYFVLYIMNHAVIGCGYHTVRLIFFLSLARVSFVWPM